MDERKNIVRVEKNKDYTIINNTSLYDDRLSWKAKAIHAFMLSKPDDWTFYSEEMAQWAKDGLDSFTTGLNELKKYGYVKKEKRRGQNGRFEWVTIVYEVPQENLQQLEQPTKPPSTEKPYMEKPSTEKPHMDSPGMEKPSMEKPRVEKPFVENPELLSTYTPSTDSLNTNIPNTKTTNHQPNITSIQDKAPIRDEGWGMVVDFYHKNIHPMPVPFVYEKLGQMYDLHPIPALALEALQIAVLNHAKNHIRYAEQILIRWRNQNITTLEHARFEQQQQQQQQQQKFNAANSPKPRRTENVPEWFYKRATAPSNTTSTIEDDDDNIDFEAERKKILQKLGR